ncbi:uncharacterized protein N7483_002209 [Penicillium malachiteum]|uniref:uncharacterized protein n=1 Tax=Penicillium malachiteum TaxID=1324776 RepID=UPI0025490187|nr:uncharacterized protein N7483_002209 [Penicillium malachiteum]KAJ5737084.1 hypothetical protein N7483_002209 [Penicillium malachiteum]
MSEGRLTRAAAKSAAASISTPSVAASDPAVHATAEATEVTTNASATKKTSSKGKGKASAKKPPVAKKKVAKKKPVKKETTNKVTKKTTKVKATLQVVSGQLPHNLGPIPSKAESSPVGSDKENQPLGHAVVPTLTASVSEAQASLDDADTTIVDQDLDTEESKEKKKKSNQYNLTPGQTPFPKWTQPTVEACELVNELLSSVHGEIAPPDTMPPPSLTVSGCGEVPSVLDALIRTLLSGATSGNNSGMAFQGLVDRFGVLDEGIGKGSVNWDAVRQASQREVFEAIQSGGLGDRKSKHLKRILDEVYAENQARREQLLSTPSTTSPAKVETDDASSSVPAENTDEIQNEIACADQNFLSLNHLHSLTSEEVMVELTKYDGIGPKTAGCVILFCLKRPCFAVDTHIFRICKWLGWLPPKVTEITAFSHLEVRIPDHLKYSLHQLFIAHGKSCPRCRAQNSEKAEGEREIPPKKQKGAKGSKKATKKATKKLAKVIKKKLTVKKAKKAKAATAKTTKKNVTAVKRKAEPDSESGTAAKKPKIDDDTEENRAEEQENPNIDNTKENTAEEQENSDETFSGFGDTEDDEWQEE